MALQHSGLPAWYFAAAVIVGIVGVAGLVTLCLMIAAVDRRQHQKAVTLALAA